MKLRRLDYSIIEITKKDYIKFKIVPMVIFMILLSFIYLHYPLVNHFSPYSDKIPDNYYLDTPKQENATLQDLQSFLDNFSYEREFSVGIFDCSEASAFLERELENAGFEAVIVRGNKHAWVLVKDISVPKYDHDKDVINDVKQNIVVESTLLICNPYSAVYVSYQKHLYDIYEAVNTPLGYYEFDWWNVPKHTHYSTSDNIKNNTYTQIGIWMGISLLISGLLFLRIKKKFEDKYGEGIYLGIKRKEK